MGDVQVLGFENSPESRALNYIFMLSTCKGIDDVLQDFEPSKSFIISLDLLGQLKTIRPSIHFIDQNARKNRIQIFYNYYIRQKNLQAEQLIMQGSDK